MSSWKEASSVPPVSIVPLVLWPLRKKGKKIEESREILRISSHVLRSSTSHFRPNDDQRLSNMTLPTRMQLERSCIQPCLFLFFYSPSASFAKLSSMIRIGETGANPFWRFGAFWQSRYECCAIPSFHVKCWWEEAVCFFFNLHFQLDQKLLLLLIITMGFCCFFF